MCSQERSTQLLSTGTLQFPFTWVKLKYLWYTFMAQASFTEKSKLFRTLGQKHMHFCSSSGNAERALLLTLGLFYCAFVGQKIHICWVRQTEIKASAQLMLL